MRRELLILACGFLVAGCTSTSVPGTTASETDDPATDVLLRGVCSIPSDEEELTDELLGLINEAREESGLEPVYRNETLSEVAGDYACDMIEEGFFAHRHPQTSQGPGERLTDAGYIYFAMGENLAVGQTSPEEVFDDWMDSEEHRAIVLSPEWREVGLAVREGGLHSWYWVEEFADPFDLVDW